MDFITELNEQAEMLVKELREARKCSTESFGATKAYHKGRAEELEKWLHSVEDLISKILKRKEAALMEKARFREALKEVDHECKYCKHAQTPVPCENSNICCDKCTFECYCKNCRNNSNYEINI